MRLKSYFAPTVEVAISRARRDLGDEAMLVDSRPTSEQNRHLGTYEVVFALSTPESTTGDPHPTKEGVPEKSPSAGGALETGFAQLRRELTRMREEVARTGTLSTGAGGAFSDPHISKLYLEMLCRDFTADFAYELATQLSMSPDLVYESAANRLAHLRSQVAARLNTLVARAQLKHRRRSNDGQIHALIGPPGSGKTTTLVKLAVHLGLKPRRSIQVLTMDNLRVGAAEQLRSYCSILGVPLQSVDSPAQMGQALMTHRGKQVILIDTPGLGPHEADMVREVGGVLCSMPAVSRHLVLSALTKASDMQRMLERFGACAPQHLVLTHLDETELIGGGLSLSAVHEFPVAYLCAGQRIPEDLEVSTVERLVSMAWDWQETGIPLGTGRQAGSAAAGLR